MDNSHIQKLPQTTHTDPTVVFRASLSCGRLLLGNGTTNSVMGMLQSGKTLMALATLMFAPQPLEEVSECVCVEGGGW